MPKCLDCGNDREFITAWVEFQVHIFQGDKCVATSSGDSERFDEAYPPECMACDSTNIEGEI